MYRIHFKPCVFEKLKMVYSRKRDLKNEGSYNNWYLKTEILTAITTFTLKLGSKFKHSKGASFSYFKLS